MAFTRTRIIKGRPYTYREERWREGGKVRSRSRIVGSSGAGRQAREPRVAMYLDADKMAANAKALSEGKPVDSNGTPIANETQAVEAANAAEAEDAPDTDVPSEAEHDTS